MYRQHEKQKGKKGGINEKCEPGGRNGGEGTEEEQREKTCNEEVS